MLMNAEPIEIHVAIEVNVSTHLDHINVYAIKDTMEKTVKDLTILVVLLPAKTEEHAPKSAHMAFHVHVQKVSLEINAR